MTDPRLSCGHHQRWAMGERPPRQGSWDVVMRMRSAQDRCLRRWPRCAQSCHALARPVSGTLSCGGGARGAVGWAASCTSMASFAPVRGRPDDGVAGERRP